MLSIYFPCSRNHTSWRDDRVVECSSLENCRAARYPGFESLSLRHKSQKKSLKRGIFYGILMNWDRDENLNGHEVIKSDQSHFLSEERRLAARGASESLSLRHLIYKNIPIGIFFKPIFDSWI